MKVTNIPKQSEQSKESPYTHHSDLRTTKVLPLLFHLTSPFFFLKLKQILDIDYSGELFFSSGDIR